MNVQTTREKLEEIKKCIISQYNQLLKLNKRKSDLGKKLYRCDLQATDKMRHLTSEIEDIDIRIEKVNILITELEYDFRIEEIISRLS